VTPVKTSTVSALFGPISAALNPSSFSVLRKFLRNLGYSFFLLRAFLLQSHVRGNAVKTVRMFLLDYSFPGLRVKAIFIIQCAFNRRNPLVSNDLTVIIFKRGGFALLRESPETVMDWRKRLGFSRKIEAKIKQKDADIRGGNISVLGLLLENETNSLGKLESLPSGVVHDRNLHIRRVGFFALNHGKKTVLSLLPAHYFTVHSRTRIQKIIKLFVDYLQRGGHGINFHDERIICRSRVR